MLMKIGNILNVTMSDHPSVNIELVTQTTPEMTVRTQGGLL